MKVFLNKLAIFLIIACFGVFVFSGTQAKAAEGDCHLEFCYVPAPTVLGPVLNQTTSSRPVIMGLTWKRTMVKVFLDGQELKNVQQIDHEDYYAGFYVKPDFNLKSGKHVIYTIAYAEHSINNDESQESTYIYFNVIKPQILALKITKPAQMVSEKSNPQISVPRPVTIKSNVVVEPAKPNNQNFQVESGKIEGGVSVTGEGLPEPVKTPEYEKKNISNLQQAATFEQIGEKLNEEFQSHLFAEKMKRNRMIGLSMLGALLLLLLCWLLCSRFTIKHELEKEVKGEVPEPPQQSQKTDLADWQVSDVPMEPIDLEEPPLEYWGEASEEAFQDNKDNENNWK